MNTLTSISLSGMNAAQSRLQTSASNIVSKSMQNDIGTSVTTPASGDVLTSITQASNSGTGLENDMIQQLMAKNSFLANLSVFKTSNDMLGTLLDISA